MHNDHAEIKHQNNLDTRRPIDGALLLLITALILGSALRFLPNITNGFPTLDGGMFYVMTRDLQAHHFLLPKFTSYNHINIPFMYPPLGFYFAAILSLLTPASDGLWIYLYIPPLLSAISIFAFYKLAKELLRSDVPASLATLVFALTSRSYFWDVMGGGITRALGKLFLLLMMQQAIHFFYQLHQSQQSARTKNDPLKPLENSEAPPLKNILLIILFGSGVILSHPAATLHAVAAGVLIFLFYGRSIRGLISAAWIGASIALLSMPWVASIALSQYGLEPFIHASQTSKQSIGNILNFLNYYSPTNYLALPLLILICFGIWQSFKQRDYFIMTWIALIYVIDSRGPEFVAPIAESLLAGLGLLGLLKWIHRLDTPQDKDIVAGRLSQAIVLTLTLYFMFTATFGGFQLINSSLKPADLELIHWVNTNIEKNKAFLLTTGHQYSMSDPLQEWFPALTDQHSVATLQGMEWTQGDNFFPWLEQLATVQQCASIECVENWRTRNSVRYDYLIVTNPDDADLSESAVALRSLTNSALNSNTYMLIHKTQNFRIFKFIE